MLRYEALMLSIPEITQDEAKELETQLDRVIKGKKGSMISFEKWGKYRLAYPVKKNDYGVYFLARFETDVAAAPLLQDIKDLFTLKMHETIMRNVVVKLNPNAPLEYQRPQSLEEAPAREPGNYFRENRGEGSRGPRRFESHDDMDNDEESA